MPDTHSTAGKDEYSHEEATLGSQKGSDLGAAGETHYDPVYLKKTIAKIDVRLLVVLGACYSISLIDRTIISVARVAGMGADLALTVGDRYTIISLIFFVPYILLELPSTLLLRRMGCRNLLSLIVLLWGSVMVGMAFVTNWQQLAVTRTLLGVLEAGFFPSCAFLISTWYTRYETQKRLAFFYLSAMVISGFSNIIGYGMSLLNGRGGLAGWRWIFLLFGIITMALSVPAYFFIVDFPDKATFLEPEQTAMILDRINTERGDAVADEVTFKVTLSHLGDFRLWLYGIMFMSSTTGAYGFAYFLPVILSGGGYSTQLSLILSAPPYVFAAIYTFAMAYASDATKLRFPFISANATLCMIGLLVMAYSPNGQIGIKYFGSFLALAGCQANIPSVLTYAANNVRSHSKRAVQSALVIGFGGIGGILASTIYMQKEFPIYLTGLWTTIGCQLSILVIMLSLTLLHRKQNAQVDAGTRVIEHLPGFKYAL